jgi:hypothetical protein
MGVDAMAVTRNIVQPAKIRSSRIVSKMETARLAA